jgi:hypothetical protein
MVNVPIPPWSAGGVLPPVDANDPTSADRSPYTVSIADVALRFGTSIERRRILAGLLKFRADLHTVGLTRGFQWLNGSFLEDVELLETRPPGDVDVVTFIEKPEAFTIPAERRQLFDHDSVKEHFSVDHYFFELDLPPQQLVSISAYWYSVWSHRRTSLWKGYLQIDLDPADDDSAAANLQLDGSDEETK